MFGKMRSKTLYAIGILFLSSLVIFILFFHNKERSFQNAYAEIPFEGLSVTLENIHPGRDLWYYESIRITIQNDLAESISLERGSIKLLCYQSFARKWVDVPYRLISSPTSDQNKPTILTSGEVTTLVLLPEYGEKVRREHYRLVILGSLAATNPSDRKVGAYLDISITPAPDIDLSLLSIKKHYTQIYSHAKQWREDAYLTRFKIRIPRKENQGGIVASYTFQSPTEENSQIDVEIDQSGRIFTVTETYGGGIERLIPIQSEELILDGPEVLTLLMQHDADIQWPSEQCDSLILRHHFPDPLEWTYYTGDCSMRVEILYVVDPNTGIITENWE